MRVAITSGVRTAIGRFGGTLLNTPAVELSAITIREALQFGISRSAQEDFSAMARGLKPLSCIRSYASVGVDPRFGLAGLCIGGGQGIAAVVEHE